MPSPRYRPNLMLPTSALNGSHHPAEKGQASLLVLYFPKVTKNCQSSLPIHRTGAKLNVPAKKVVKFKAGSRS